jgi:glycosyltransferase involved in cell wall biosynthesis
VLLLVGDGPMKEEILTKARQRGVAERVHLAGSVPHEETPLYYRLMSVCVLPSETEGGWRESFGRALVEAMACGVPVIGSSSGAIPDTIDQAGRIFPEGNARALANAIRDVLENPRAADRLRTAGLARARDFTWEAIAAINYQAYLHILRMQSPSQRR